MKPLPLILSLAFAAPLAAEDIAVPMADGNVLRGERVDDPEVAGKGVRLKTGGVMVFVPWGEMAPGARELIEKGLAAAPPDRPPLAPAPGPPPPPEPPPAAEIAQADGMDGEAPEMPECLDPRL